MGYIKKDTILSAYHCLSDMTKDKKGNHDQGATKKVSALRYFIAFDRFYKKHNRNCNTRNSSDRKEFIELVGDFCKINNEEYTSNFFVPLTKSGSDFNVGSNFYSAGQMSKSSGNPTSVFPYPTKFSLIDLHNEELVFNSSYYANLSHYVGETKYKVALIIWILRNTEIKTDDNEPIEWLSDTFKASYTEYLYSILFTGDADFKQSIGEYDLGLAETKCDLEDKDITDMFDYQHKKNNEINLERTYKGSNIINFLTAIRTKPFVLLAGISGTGKSRIVRKLAQATVTEELQKKYDKDFNGKNFEEKRWKLHTPANFEIIQVKPNWHNSMDVVGYLSNLPSPHYVFTPFIKFIVKAWLNPEIPFFLCLDEMNLAPVEEYFAEYLSAIESRSFENGEYKTDPIIKPFNDYEEVEDEMGNKINVCEQMINALFPNFKAYEADSPHAKVIKHFKKEGLTLPQNLVVIGTVNMDETTFSFSRKVLDRAMSIEMNDVDYDSFLRGTTDDELKSFVSQYERKDLDNMLVNREIDSQDVVINLGEDAKFVIEYLKQINALLDGSQYKLGYRAANEALLYLNSSKKFGFDDTKAALDNFTVMKILSRIEGDSTKLKLDKELNMVQLENAKINSEEVEKQLGELNILTALRFIITQKLGIYYQEDTSKQNVDSSEDQTDNQSDNITSNSTDEDASEKEENSTPKHKDNKTKLISIRKIDSMITQLKRDHFVSFWN